MAGGNQRRKRSLDDLEDDFTAGDLYKDFMWQTKNSSLTLNHAMATFSQMRVPTRIHGMANKQDLPKGYIGRFLQKYLCI